MKPWILCVKERPKYEDVIEHKIVFYDFKYRNVYINEIPISMTDSEFPYENLGWMKIEDFIENCSEFPLND